MSEKNSHGYPDTMLKGLADNAPYRPPGTTSEVVPSAPEPDTNAYSNPAFSTPPYRPPSTNPDILLGASEPCGNAYSNPAFNGTQYDPPPPYPGTSSVPISMPIPAPPAPPISTQPTTYQAYPTTAIGQDSSTQTSDKKNKPMSDSNPVTLITIQPPFHPSLPSNDGNEDAEKKERDEEERENACCVCLTWCDICTDWTCFFWDCFDNR